MPPSFLPQLDPPLLLSSAAALADLPGGAGDLYFQETRELGCFGDCLPGKGLWRDQRWLRRQSGKRGGTHRDKGWDFWSFGPILLKVSDGATLSYLYLCLCLFLSLPITLILLATPNPQRKESGRIPPWRHFLGRPGLFRASATAVTFTTSIWEGRSTESWSRQKARKTGASLV